MTVPSEQDEGEIEQPSQAEFEAAYEDYVDSKPLPLEHELDDAECHNCGEPWNDGDEWDVRHHNVGPSIGEDWFFTCPNCDEETFECGT